MLQFPQKNQNSVKCGMTFIKVQYKSEDPNNTNKSIQKVQTSTKADVTLTIMQCEPDANQNLVSSC